MTQKEFIKKTLEGVKKFKNERGNIEITEGLFEAYLELAYGKGELNSLKSIK